MTIFKPLTNLPRSPSRLYVQDVGIARSPDFLFLHLITALLFLPRSLRFQSLMVASWEQVRNSSLILGCQLPELMTAVWPLFLVWSRTYWSPLRHSNTLPPSRSRTCTQTVHIISDSFLLKLLKCQSINGKATKTAYNFKIRFKKNCGGLSCWSIWI